MKIAHLVCQFPPYRGGMGNVAHEQVRRLADMGHEVTVFTLSNYHDTTPSSVGVESTPPKLGGEGEHKYKVEHPRAFPRLGNGGFCPQIIKKLRDFDLIQLHYPFFGVQEMLWFGKKLGLIKARLVIFYHMDASFNNWFLKILSCPTRLVRRSLFKMADHVFCASLDYVAHSEIKNIYYDYQKKFIEIPFGVSHSPSDLNRSRLEEIKQQISWHPNIKNILFVGNLDKAHYFKGVNILLESLKKLSAGAQDFLPLPNTKLLIVGEGDLRPVYQDLARELNIYDHVIFLARVSDLDLPCYYYLADTVVLPSLTKAEAFGLVLAEAESFGKPVIASDLPGVRGVVGEAGLLAKPGDVDDLAEKIKIILTDENARQKFSASALHQAKEKYNWDEHVIVLNQLYKK
ncbi:glycosyltransferase family 4 protein [Candidatus Kuenenbacteria bacterium]|nr:glycosyltransferase family 4 protein [Candidatus Kuenenbacteria bacterium]